ncbi:MAG: MarR family transcriptional regulator [Rhodospirillaceae bacterium]|nr:MarR family transcriptional regulator [Rhodospirillaceae bacterium]
MNAPAKSSLRRKTPVAHRARIRTAGSPFFQLLVLANLTARPFSERFGRRLHLGLSEWRVLLVVADRPGITAQDLADYIGLDKMSVSRAVRQLQARGRLARSANPRDRRSLHLNLTPEGWRVYEEIAASGAARERDVFGALDAKEQEEFFERLTRLVASTRRLDQKP